MNEAKDEGGLVKVGSCERHEENEIIGFIIKKIKKERRIASDLNKPPFA